MAEDIQAKLDLLKPPFFILGSPRSGTTLFRLMLTCHRQLMVPPECGFALWWEEKWGNWAGRDLEQCLPAFLDDLFTSKKFETWELPRDKVTDVIREIRPASYRALVESVYLAYSLRDGKQLVRWGDKNNFYLEHIPRLQALFPGCRFLHIIRDGRDVACSYKNLAARSLADQYAPNLPSTIGPICEQWRSNNQRILDSFRALEKASYFSLRFEDIVADPRQTLDAVCRFLEVDYDPQMLRYHELNATNRLEPASFKAWKSKTYSPPRQDEIGRFERELDAHEITYFNREAASLLQQFGYLHQQ